MRTPRFVVIVGGPGSGKDFAIQAMNDLGAQHAQIIPKHTSRRRKADDEAEMVCSDDEGYALDRCDILYENYGAKYGLMTKEVWRGLRGGVFQVAVVSNLEAINGLRRIFGSLLLLVYVHSEVSPEEFKRTSLGTKEYVEERYQKYRMAFDLYLDNFLAFDHVLIWSGDRENLFDQIFRLFRAYDQGLAK